MVEYIADIFLITKSKFYALFDSWANCIHLAEKTLVFGSKTFVFFLLKNNVNWNKSRFYNKFFYVYVDQK